MRILITGGSGMLGRNIVTLAKTMDFDVMAPARQELDLMNFNALNAYINRNKPEAIIHCAGLVGGIHLNIARPFDFAFVNAQLGLNVIKASLENNIDKLLNIGSSSMYPKEASNPLEETGLLKGELDVSNEGYSVAKILVSKLCEYASTQYNANFKTVLPCNLYGYWDNFSPKQSHMIPGVIRRVHEAKIYGKNTVEIWGDGQTRREFMFAEDLANFCLTALKKYEKLDNLTNVGLGYDHSIAEYYQAIANIVGYKGKFTFDLDKPVGAEQRLVSVTKVNRLGWKAAHSLELGLSKTYEFYLREYCND